MITRKKRGALFCLLAISILFLTIFRASLFPLPTKSAALHLSWQGNDDSLELALTDGQTIKGWEKEGVVYFFVPTYVSEQQIALDFPLKWQFTDETQTDLQYDAVQTLLLYNHADEKTASKNICFKHSANVHTIFLDLRDLNPDSLTRDAFTETSVQVVSPQGLVEYNESGNFIKGRGNSTWETDKKPYYLKLSKRSSLCGMEPGRKWVLLANAYESTKLSNKLLFDFSRTAGLQCWVDSEWADLYINGEYRGNYLVCEKIDVDRNVVDISDLEKENEKVYQYCEPFAEEFQRGFITDQSPVNITGGYLLEKDMTIYDSPCGFMTDHRTCFVIHSPNNASLEEVSYIRSCLQNIEDLLRQQDEQLLQYIDADSFARRYLIEELALNSDAYITSCYYYKKRNDDKIYAGPVWDYDAVLGASNVIDYESLGNVWLNYDETSVLFMNKYRSTIAVLDWEKEFQDMPAYMEVVRQTYKTMQQPLDDLLYHRIDDAAARIKQSVSLDQIRWDDTGHGIGHYSSFDNNVRYMKFFLAKRINFLNRKFGMEEWSYEDTDHTLHEITCIDGNGGIDSITVPDGSLLKPENLPKYDREKYDGWMYERDRASVSAYLPVYEDMTLVSKPRSGIK